MIKSLVHALVSLVLLSAASTTTLAENNFKFALPADPETLDWTRASTTFETYAIMNIMEGLVEIDSALQPTPGLAESWEISKDGRTYTFKLKPGVKWSDGAPLSARDFIFSWKRLLAPASHSEYASFLFDVTGAEDYHRGRLRDFSKVGVQALDSGRIQIQLRRVVPYFLTLLSFWVTFPQREDLVATKGWDQPPKLVTLGPYKVSKWEKGKQILFERNPTYYGPAPQVASVQAIIEPELAKRRKLFADNKIDALLNVSTEDILAHSTSTSTTGKQLRQFDYLATVFLAFNVRAQGGVPNAGLRRAIGHALDRSKIPAYLQGGQVPASSLVPKGIAAFDPAVGITPDIDAAKTILHKSGLGSKALPKLSLIYIDGPFTRTAEYVRDTLKSALGLEVELKRLPLSAYLKARRSGRFQSAIVQWGADYPDASSFLELFVSDAAANYTGWKNAEYDKLIKFAAGSLKVLDRLQAYTDAQKLLTQEDSVVLPLYYPKNTALIDAKVSEFEINPLNYLFFKRIKLK